jgi:hypothetical protein
MQKGLIDLGTFIKTMESWMLAYLAMYKNLPYLECERID